ncbi:MAG: indole-3-glycerol phosphate synthase TrpC [Bacteroidota bacterium]
MSVLDTILLHKRTEIKEMKDQRSQKELIKGIAEAESPRSFAQALRGHGLSVIAEIKKASPSRGVLSHDFDHRSLAKEFQSGGARALSVLTDERFFHGKPEFIADIKSICNLPVLRKDFILDEYQVYESRLLGADAILLIVKALPKKDLEQLYRCAKGVQLDVLVEAHTREEVDIANEIGAEIIGINNRDLDTFEVSLERSLQLRSHVNPKAISVSESGIMNSNDIGRLQMAGFDAVLVGEGLMKSQDRAKTLRELVHS